MLYHTASGLCGNGEYKRGEEGLKSTAPTSLVGRTSIGTQKSSLEIALVKDPVSLKATYSDGVPRYASRSSLLN